MKITKLQAPSSRETSNNKHQTHLASAAPDWLLKLGASLVLGCWCLVLPLAAQPTPTPPGQISYQGFLTDASGIALATNRPVNYTVLFRIYNSSTGTTNAGVQWGEQQVVTVDRGYFTVLLGNGSAITGANWTNNLASVFSGTDASDRYLGMTVVELGGAEIVPRLRLMASPYAFLAAGATKLVSSVTGADLVTSTGSGLTLNAPINGTVTATAFSGSGTGLTGLAPDIGSTNYVQNQTNVDQAAGLRINGNAIFNGGRVAIGTTSPSRALEVHRAGDTEIGIQSTDANSHLWTLQSSSTTNLLGPSLNASFQILDRTAGASRLFISPGGKVGIGTTTPATQLSVAGNADFSGQVGIGTTSISDTLQVNGVIQGVGFRCRAASVNPPDYGHIFNFDWSGSVLYAYIDDKYVGTVQGTSDRRLKEDIQPLANDALNRVMALKPSLFKYKDIPGSIFHGDGRVNEGFIADELQQVIPSAVNGEKDALTKDGQIQPQTLNIIPVVSVLTKAVQEQQQTIQRQETEITELKARLEKLEAFLAHSSNGSAR